MISGIIFDVEHTEALLRFAGSERHSANSLGKDVLQDSLVSMILFDRVKIVPLRGRHGSGMEILYAEDFVSDLSFSIFDQALRNVDEYKKSFENAILSPPDSILQSEFFTTYNLFDRIIGNYFPFVVNSALPGRDMSWSAASRLIADVCIELPIVDEGLVIEQEGYSKWFDIPALAASDQLLQKHAVESRLPDLVSSFYDFDMIIRKLIEYWGLFLHSRETGYPVKATCRHVTTTLDQSLGSDALQLFQIHMQEVGILPVLESVDDILRLRGHPFLANFREAIFERLEEIACGNTNEDQKYRNYVKTANEELKKLGKWKYVDSPYYVLASLVIGAVEPLIGGPILTALGGLAATERIQKNRKYGFAAFPR